MIEKSANGNFSENRNNPTAFVVRGDARDAIRKEVLYRTSDHTR